MQYKIFEQNGIDNENVDGAAFNNFCAGNRNGIIKEVLNECAVFKASQNTITISTGEMLIHGVRVKITDFVTFTLSSVPTAPIRYQIIADLVLTPERTIEFGFVNRVLQNELIQDALYKTESGHYQVEIARFTHAPSGIEDIVRTIDIITGGTSGDNAGAYINIGNVTTRTLAAGLDAEVDVEPRFDEEQGKEVLDFSFSIPQGKDSDVLSDGTYPDMTVGNADKLTVAKTINGVPFDGSTDITNYAICWTSSNTQAKVVAKTGFKLAAGARITVRFMYGNTVLSPTLNVGGTGAKSITAINDAVYIKWRNNDILDLIYTGTAWLILGGYALADKPVGTHVLQCPGEDNPASRFGGTWKIDAAMQGRTIIGSGGEYVFTDAGTTGGSTQHSHQAGNLYAKFTANSDGTILFDYRTVSAYNTRYKVVASSAAQVNSSGINDAIILGGSTDNAAILSPYLVVNWWERTA